MSKGQQWIKLQNFRMALGDQRSLEQAVAERLGLPTTAIKTVNVMKRSLDARRKPNIQLIYSLLAMVQGDAAAVLQKVRDQRDLALWQEPERLAICAGEEPLAERPVVVGFGPAGMFAALTLAERGYRPLVLERGQDMDARVRDVQAFWQQGRLDPASNVQFGEGGAGTFSDGKLTTRVQDPRMAQVLDGLIAAGAPEEIRFDQKPHVGTDKLREVVKGIRRRIIALGGEVRFQSQVAEVEIAEGRLTGLGLQDGTRIPCAVAIFAIGHSARDTYELLCRQGVDMEAKPFAIGVRIEHPQDWIDQAQYGSAAGHPRLGAADYALVHQAKELERAVYSFCMCPGGLVIASSSEAGGVVTNGMSFHSRASGTANSALVVNVSPADFGSQPLDGIRFQRQYEQAAYTLAGSSYAAPAQTVGDFLRGTQGKASVAVQSSYRPGVRWTDLRQCLPEFVTAALAQALPAFGRKIKGFDHPEAVLTGVETRTSAPVRILRGENYESRNIRGLYPLGEGAGYAGGIMSAAVDGVNGAIAIIERYRTAER